MKSLRPAVPRPLSARVALCVTQTAAVYTLAKWLITDYSKGFWRMVSAERASQRVGVGCVWGGGAAGGAVPKRAQTCPNELAVRRPCPHAMAKSLLGSRCGVPGALHSLSPAPGVLGEPGVFRGLLIQCFASRRGVPPGGDEVARRTVSMVPAADAGAHAHPQSRAACARTVRGAAQALRGRSSLHPGSRREPLAGSASGRRGGSTGPSASVTAMVPIRMAPSISRGRPRPPPGRPWPRCGGMWAKGDTGLGTPEQ